MALDSNTGCHYITIANLLDLLSDSRLNGEDLLYPNQVGNLAIVRNGEYIGFIHLGVDEQVTIFSEDDDEG